MTVKPPWVYPRCIECGGLGVLTPGKTAFPGKVEAHTRAFYVCTCGASVGCHPRTNIPLGYPCGPYTAMARDKAHRALDRRWKPKVGVGHRWAKARRDAYRWLATELGIKVRDCHIARFDEAMCRRVIELCREPDQS